MHDVATGVRYEDDIEVLDVAFTTFGRNVTRPLRAASSGWGGVTVANTLVLGTSLPQEAPAASGNLAVSSAAFVDAAANDYRLPAGSPAVDAARAAVEVATDRIGTARPQGVASDVGAYERPAAAQVPAAPTGLSARALLSGAKASVTLAWRDNATNETGVELQRSVNGSSFTTLATLAADTTTFVDATVARRTTYWYRVRAVNAAGSSGYSGTVSVTTKVDQPTGDGSAQGRRPSAGTFAAEVRQQLPGDAHELTPVTRRERREPAGLVGHVRRHEFIGQPRAARRELDVDAAAIRRIRAPLDEARRLEAVEPVGHRPAGDEQRRGQV